MIITNLGALIIQINKIDNSSHDTEKVGHDDIYLHYLNICSAP